MTSKLQNVHHTSTLPSILDTYMSSKCTKKTANDAKALTQKMRLTSSREREAILDPDEVAKVKRKALLDQRHLETYWSIHRLRDMMSRRYAALLREKVQRQRQEIKQRHTAPGGAADSHTEQRRRRPTAQKLTCSTLSHDDSYLRSLPKTRFYLILELQRQLARRGGLRTQQDMELFWQWVDQNPGMAQLERRLQEMVLCSKSVPDLKLEGLIKQEVLGPPPAIQITDEGHQDHITVCERGSGASLHGKQLQEQDETEQMFPKLCPQQIPKFVTLQPSFLEAFKTNMLLVRVNELPQKTRTTDVNLRKLRLMHSLSLSHMAHSQRLLDRVGPTMQWEEECSVRDLMEYVSPRIESIRQERRPGNHLLPHPSQKHHARPRGPEAITLKLSTTPLTSHQPENKAGDTEACHSRAHDSINPEEPLSMDHVCQQNMSVVIDCSYKTWKNYA